MYNFAYHFLHMACSILHGMGYSNVFESQYVQVQEKNMLMFQSVGCKNNPENVSAQNEFRYNSSTILRFIIS